MNKKNIKILILVISPIVLWVLFPQIEVKPLSQLFIDPPVSLSSKNVKVSLNIEDKKYDVEIKEGATVFEVIQKIREENRLINSFDFKYKEHMGMGVFITEINGIKGGMDGYWIYSVNGEEAKVGVSNYKIKNGDIISWKYEK